jgi:activating signal cointegrator complex subunit 2
VLELAYIENPKLFDRDSGTRRSKARADLKAKTGMLKASLTDAYLHYSPGWGDEQIEGWKIMLERNVRSYTVRVYNLTDKASASQKQDTTETSVPG